MCKHLSQNIVVELLDLFSNISQEGVAQPVTDHHDEEEWAAAREHCHGHSQANLVGSYCLPIDVEYVFPDQHNCVPQCIGDLCGSDVVGSIVLSQG